MIPLSRELMHRHDALFLEEPPTLGFRRMLEGKVQIDDYMRLLDVEYPEFSRQMCGLLRELHAQGKHIFQVEPFIGCLLSIHEFFAHGHGPNELKKNSLQYPVYLAERNATGALLAYYRTVMTGSFEETLEAVQHFARMDAARFRLRDSLRAQELASVVIEYSSSYIEAGVIHYSLWRLLRQGLSKEVRMRPVFLADAALKTFGEKGHLYGPGDQLTLRYIFHPHMAGETRHSLLAARAIVYAKIIRKDELTRDVSVFPHLRDELSCIRTTAQLTYDDCRRLFPLIRRANTYKSRQIVKDYLTVEKSSRKLT
jgi:hypothetical protein